MQGWLRDMPAVVDESPAPAATPPRPRRRRWLWALLAAVLTVAAAGAIAVQRWTVTLEPRLHRELEAWLSDRFKADVTLERLDVRLYPHVIADAVNLTLRIRNRPDLPPFITIGHWSGTAELSRVGIRHFREVRLDDVKITIPPRRLTDIRGPKDPGAPKGPRKRPQAITVDRLVAEHVVLEVLSRDPSREPHVWDIRDLAMEPFSFDVAAPFEATVDTPLPADRAVVRGVAGPWPDGDFDQLPLQGEYTLDGNLADVPGLLGNITVTGSALGTLDRLATHGTLRSERAGFRAGSTTTLPLEVTYDAVVDATNSDVFITNARATAGGAIVEAAGHVVKHKGTTGRHVHLTVQSPPESKAADVMRLLIDGARPPVSGYLGLDASVNLPPGPADVLERLSLAGTFRLEAARFINERVQSVLDDMSRRGQGRPVGEVSRVPASIRGSVRLHRRELGVERVSLAVPGARIDAAGRYSLADETLGFRGVTRLDARFSETQTGMKRIFLKPLNALFSRDGAGTRVVLDVRGTKGAPVVDVDLGATLRGRK